MTGVEPRTSGIGSNRSTNWATQPQDEFFVSSEASLCHTWADVKLDANASD